jgi:hypothetical protein
LAIAFRKGLLLFWATEEDRRISEIRKQISERFKEGMKREVDGKPKASEKATSAAKKESKEPAEETTDSDTSVSIHFPDKIKAKAVPKKASWQKFDIPDHSAPASSPHLQNLPILQRGKDQARSP